MNCLPRSLLLGVLSWLLFFPTIALARWSTEFAAVQDIRSQDGIPCMTLYENQLVLGGSFTQIGGRDVRGVARWDGRDWQPLGSGLGGEVYKTLVWHGRLIAAGAGLCSGSGKEQRPIGGVAAFDGSDWQQLGRGIKEAYRLAVWRDQLVAVGLLSPDSVTVVPGVAVLQGNRWGQLGSIPETDKLLWALLAVWNGNLFLEVPLHGITRWTGSDWSPQGPDSTMFVLGPVVTPDGLLAQVQTGTEQDKRTWRDSIRILQVLGGTWRTVEKPRSLALWGRLRLLGPYRDGALFLGDSKGPLYIWTHAGWDSLMLPYPGLPIAALEAKDRLWLLFSRTRPQVTQVISWDGRQWSLPEDGLGVDHQVTAFLPDGQRLLVAGAFDRCGMQDIRRLAAWDGHAWAPFSGPEQSTKDTTICWMRDIGALIRWQGSLFGAGYFHSYGGRYSRRHSLARWDNGVWRPVGGVTESCRLPTGDLVNEVTAVAAVPTSKGLVVAGGFGTAQGQTLNGIGLWDGQRWHPLGDEPGCTGDWCFPGFTRLVPFRDGVVAVGALRLPGGSRQIGFWDGLKWSFMDGGMDGRILDLALDDGRVIAGGSFTWAGGVIAPNIAAWNGERWSSVGEGLPGPVTALGHYHGHLIAAVRGEPVQHYLPSSLWVWDGKVWTPFEGGADFQGEIQALCQYNGDLYVGGDFESVNGIPSSHIARWCP